MPKEKKQRTEEAILHAAKVLFERRGLGGGGFDAIAREAGVSRTTVFHYFPSTDRLFDALQAAELEEILAAAREKRGLNRIHVLLDKLVEDTAAYPHMMTYLTNHLILSPQGHCIGKLEALLAQGLAEMGRGDDAANRRLAVMLLGQYYGLVNHTHIHALPFDPLCLKKALWEMALTLLELPLPGRQERTTEP